MLQGGSPQCNVYLNIFSAVLIPLASESVGKKDVQGVFVRMDSGEEVVGVWIRFRSNFQREDLLGRPKPRSFGSTPGSEH